MRDTEFLALWKNEKTNTDGTKTEYWTGKLGNARIIGFKNKFKETDKHPDLKLYFAPPRDDNHE